MSYDPLDCKANLWNTSQILAAERAVPTPVLAGAISHFKG
jgi:hypothetical protein